MMALQIETIVSTPFVENTYVLWHDGRTDAVVVDPGLQPGLILDTLKKHGLTPVVLLCTHGHADHIAGNKELKQAFPNAPILIGEGDAALLTDPDLNLSTAYGLPLVSPPADRLVRDGDVLELAGIRLEVREIPGHSPGHVVYVIREVPVIVVGGDVLFRGSVGRTDLPGGSFALLASGIRDKLWPLPDDTAVYPGHGLPTTIGQEKRTNPFVGQGQLV